MAQVSFQKRAESRTSACEKSIKPLPFDTGDKYNVEGGVSSGRMLFSL
jgi:hypothetical protein